MSALPARRQRSPQWVAGVLAGALALGVAGCSWRMEQEPVIYPSADEVTLERDAAAEREQQIVDALASGSSDAGQDLNAIESAAAPAHLEALGGVYVAMPSPSPSPFPYTGALDAAVEFARDQALQTALHTPDTNLAFLQSSMGLSHSLALWWSTTGSELSVPESEPSASASPAPVAAADRILPSGVNLGESFTPLLDTTVDSSTLSELAVAHDKAQYLYEMIAAKESGSEQDNALARRDAHAARSDELAALTSGGDAREVLYDVPPSDIVDAESRAATALATEFALGETYASMLDGISPEDRGWILNAAFDAYAAGMVQPGYELTQFPVLPGVATS